MLGVAALSLPVFYSGYRITRAEGLVFLCLYLPTACTWWRSPPACHWPAAWSG